MKKTYIKPQTTHMTVSYQSMISASAHTTGAVNVTYGGTSGGGMSSDTHSVNSWDIWGEGDFDEE